MQVMMTKYLTLASSEFVLELASSEVSIIWMVFIHFHSFPGDSTETRSELSITMDPSLQPDEILTDTPVPPASGCQVCVNMVSKCQIWAPLFLC